MRQEQEQQFEDQKRRHRDQVRAMGSTQGRGGTRGRGGTLGEGVAPRGWDGAQTLPLDADPRVVGQSLKPSGLAMSVLLGLSAALFPEPGRRPGIWKKTTAHLCLWGGRFMSFCPISKIWHAVHRRLLGQGKRKQA